MPPEKPSLNSDKRNPPHDISLDSVLFYPPEKKIETFVLSSENGTSYAIHD